MDARMEQLADDATIGLKDDPELRLDVRAELLSHMREREEEYRAAGRAEDESAELAIKSFGSPLDIADELVEANKSRMKLRALARMFMRTLLAPAAVLIAICAFINIDMSMSTPRWVMVRGDSPTMLPYATIFSSAKERKDFQQLRFLVLGDIKRPTLPEQQRAIWEAHPRSKAYFANYAGYLCADDIHTVDYLNFVVRELRRGEQLDPQNALYNYLIAGSMLKLAVEDREIPATGHQHSHTEQVVKDRRLLDQAMHELRLGMAKPAFTTYRRDLEAQWGRLLPPPQRFFTSVSHRMNGENDGVAKTTQLIVDDTPLYAKLLLKAGRKQDAFPYLNAWEHLGNQQLDEATDFMGLSSAVYLFSSGGLRNARIYKAIGRKDLEIQTLKRVDHITAPFRKWESNNPEGDLAFFADIGGTLTTIILPMYGKQYAGNNDLAPERNLWQVFIEEAIVVFICLLLLAWMLASVALSVRWHLHLREAHAASLLLLPPAGVIARIFGVTMLLPLALYLLVTHALMYADLRLSFLVRMGIFIAPFFALLIYIGMAPVVRIERVIGRRCAALGVPVPEKRARARNDKLTILFGSLWGSGMFCAADICSLFNCNNDIAVWLMRLATTIVFALLAILPGIMRKRPEPYALYFGTIARSLIPMYAITLILIAGVIYPSLVGAEKYWLRHDRLIIPQAHEYGLPIERRFVEDMKYQMTRARKTAPPTPSTTAN